MIHMNEKISKLSTLNEEHLCIKRHDLKVKIHITLHCWRRYLQHIKNEKASHTVGEDVNNMPN